MSGHSARSFTLSREAKTGVGIFLFALVLRLIGITWGLPNALHFFSYHPDEYPIWNYAQKLDPAHFNFTPGFYNYGTLYLTVVKVLTDMVTAYGGGPAGKDPLSSALFIGRCQLAGRVAVACCGAGMASTVWAIMRRWTSSWGAALGALLVAGAPAALVHSRFQTVDIPAAFLWGLSTLYALKLIPSPADSLTADAKLRLRYALLSGLFAGFSAGTKYTGILALLTLLVVLLVVRKPGDLKAATLGLLAALVAMLAGTPGMLLDTAAFMRDLRFESHHAQVGQIEFYGTAPGYVYHLQNLGIGFGYVPLIVGIVGLAIAALRRKHLWAIATLAAAVPYYLLIGGEELKFLRYTFPLFIPLACAVAWILGGALTKLSGTEEAKRLVAVFANIVVFAQLLVTGVMATVDMVNTDSRDIAGQYLHDAATASATDKSVGLVADPWFWSPAVFPMAAGPRPADGLFPAMNAATHPRVLMYSEAPDRIDWDARLLSEDKPDYVTFTDYSFLTLDRFKASGWKENAAPVLVARYEEFMDHLQAGYTLDRTIGAGMSRRDLPPDMLYTGMVAQIWKRKELH